MTATVIPLIDGALYHDPRTYRQQVIDQMAADIIRWGVWRNEDDSFRALVYAQNADGGTRYKTFDVVTCLDDARQIAAQTIIAEAMEDKPC